MYSEPRPRTGGFRTIGARLTILGMGVTLLICGIVCLVLYFGLAYSLRREIDNFIAGEVDEFCSILNEDADDSPREIEGEIRREVGSRLRGDLTFRLLSPAGETVISSSRTNQYPLVSRPAPPEEGAPAALYYESLELTGTNHRVRACGRWIYFHGKPHLAQATYRLDNMEHSLALFRRVCGGGLLLAAVLSFFGGRLLAKRLLHPVREMTSLARAITATRLSSDRLTCSGSGDEIDGLAETLNDMLDRIHRHLRQVQQFTADASHELRTPLAALRGAAEVALTHSRTPEELRQLVQDSIERYDGLTRIAEDLLLLARLDSGDPVLRPERVRLDTAVADVVDLYEPYAAERRIDLSFEPRVEIWADVDGGRIRQVIGNLIDNAIKYTDHPGKVRIGLSAEDSEAVFTVEDNGVGIPASDLPCLFDRFFRGNRARGGSERRGVGLGLSICKSIVEAQGGRIEVRSAVREGTWVKVHLPLVKPEHVLVAERRVLGSGA